MGIALDHTIVLARDAEASARWFAELFGMAEPAHVGHFWQVTTSNGVDLDFDDHDPDDGPFTPQHYAFEVSDDEFDTIFERIRTRLIEHWADPNRTRPGEINHRRGGRGVYFPNTDGHLLEIFTRPHA
jgi:catechol 2,3-dioxygenase-like lactoylglutathione lyase family enzyme